MHIANYQAMMETYHQFIWEEFQSVIEVLPQEKQMLCSLLPARSLRTCQPANPLCMPCCRWCSEEYGSDHSPWLCSVSLPKDSKSCIEDLPFNGNGLFSTKKDDFMRLAQKENLCQKNEHHHVLFSTTFLPSVEALSSTHHL